MKIEGEGQLLRVYVAETDTHDGRPLHEMIVHRARAEGMAGATVLRGMMGFGANSMIHTDKVSQISSDMPICVEIVDQAEKIKRFIPILDRMVKEGLITLEKVNIIAYRHSKHFM